MIDADAHPSVDLGRAALSGLSRRDRRVERRRRTGRPATGSPAGSARAPLDALIAAILDRCRRSATSTAAALGESVDGYVIDRPMSPRAAIEPLALAYAFDAGEVDGMLRFRPRGGEPRRRARRGRSACCRTDRAPARLTRAQETELAARGLARLHRAGSDYRRAAATSRRLVGGAARSAPCRSRGGDERRRGRAARRHLAAGSVGRPRERRVRAAAEPARARRRRRGRARRSAGAGRLLEIARHRRYRRPRGARAVDRSGRVRPAARAAAPARRRCRRRRSGRCMRCVLDLPTLDGGRAAGPAAARGVRRSVAGRGRGLALGRRR